MCDANAHYEGISIYESLCNFLKQYNITNTNIISDFNGKSIIIDNNGSIEACDIKANKSKLLFEIVQQKAFIKANRYYVNAKLFTKEIRKYKLL